MRLKAFGQVLLLVFFIIMCSGFDVCDARQGRHWRSRRGPSSSSLAKKKGKGKFGNGPSNHHGGGGGRSSPAPKPPKSSSSKNPSPSPSPSVGKGYPAPSQDPSGIYNVLDFGAKGNGVTDDTKAFQSAWSAACKAEESTMLVPSGYTYLVGPISFSGPYCQPNIVFQEKIVKCTSLMASTSQEDTANRERKRPRLSESLNAEGTITNFDSDDLSADEVDDNENIQHAVKHRVGEQVVQFFRDYFPVESMKRARAFNPFHRSIRLASCIYEAATYIEEIPDLLAELNRLRTTEMEERKKARHAESQLIEADRKCFASQYKINELENEITTLRRRVNLLEGNVVSVDDSCTS